MTVPTPGRASCVFGAGAASASAIPLTTRPTNPEPAALLVAELPLLALLARARTAFAVIRPPRRFTFCNVELLCALAAFSPITPVVIEASDSAARTPMALTLAACASVIPEAGSSVASGDRASDAVGVWSNAPYASPAMLLEACAIVPRTFHMSPASSANAAAPLTAFAALNAMIVPPGVPPRSADSSLAECLQVAAGQDACVEVHLYPRAVPDGELEEIAIHARWVVVAAFGRERHTGGAVYLGGSPDSHAGLERLVTCDRLGL